MPSGAKPRSEKGLAQAVSSPMSCSHTALTGKRASESSTFLSPDPSPRTSDSDGRLILGRHWRGHRSHRYWSMYAKHRAPQEAEEAKLTRWEHRYALPRRRRGLQCRRLPRIDIAVRVGFDRHWALHRVISCRSSMVSTPGGY